MKFKKIIFIIAIAVSSSSALAINCVRAKTPAEMAICSNPSLKAFDNYLSDAYATIRDSINPDVFAGVRKSQIQWIRQRDLKCGGEVACLMQEIDSRTAVLNDFMQKYKERSNFQYREYSESAPSAKVVTSPLDATEIYKIAAQSVVIITAFDKNRNEVSQGSGVVVGINKVATNCHVIEGAITAKIIFRGKSYKAIKISGDRKMDYCVLTTANLPAKVASIDSLSTVTPGQRVYSIGSPRGLELTIAEGLVSGLRPKNGVPLPLIQTSAAISPGSSGGGLFNEFGRVIGVTTFLLKDSQNLNFALPVELHINFD